MKKNRMIFLTTPMRSGSSLLSRMLSAHPEIEMSYDTVNYFRFCYQRYDPISQSDNARRLVEDMSFRLGNRFNICLDVNICLDMLEKTLPNYGNLYWAILKTIFPNHNKTYLGDKESMAWTRIPSFLDMFPDGKAIIIVRDPRDVVNSFKHTTIAKGNDYLIALFDVLDAINHAIRFSSRIPNSVMMVRFEMLKTQPEIEMRRLCQFLDINFDPAMLDEHAYTDHSGKLWNGNESFSFSSESDRLAPIGRWRNMLSPDDLFLCEWIARNQIQAIGQALSGTSFTQKDFDSAISKLSSSALLMDAFKKWCETGEGVEKFPLDPTSPANWDPAWVNNPEAFKSQKIN